MREPWLSDGGCIDGNYDDFLGAGNVAVQSLINTTSKEWNVGVIEQVFSHADSRRILDTPLIDQVTEDKLIWKAERNGFYSVKSAYRLCVDVLTDSSHLRKGGYWQGIWRLKVPPKVRNLIWRICRDVVPTRRRLQDKGVQCPLSCVVCNGSEEDLDHILFNCPFSVQVWQRMGLWNPIQQTYLTSVTVPDCIFALIQQFDVANSQHFTATLWSLWKHRNLKLWQDVNETAAQVMDRAFHLIEDWSSANSTT
jgi:hypothetical protein